MLMGLERSKQEASQQRKPELWLFFKPENQAWLKGSSLEKMDYCQEYKAQPAPPPRIGCVPEKLQVMRTAVYGLTLTGKFSQWGDMSREYDQSSSFKNFNNPIKKPSEFLMY